MYMWQKEGMYVCVCVCMCECVSVCVHAKYTLHYSTKPTIDAYEGTNKNHIFNWTVVVVASFARERLDLH